jgi:hypothetical protein
MKNRLYRFCSQLPQGENTTVAQDGLDNGANLRHNATRKTKGKHVTIHWPSANDHEAG